MKRPLTAVALALAAGAVASRLWYDGMSIYAGTVVIAFTVYIALSSRYGSTPHVLLFLMLTFFALGVVRGYLSVPCLPGDGEYIETDGVVKTVITGESDYGEYAKLTVVCKEDSDGRQDEAPGELLGEAEVSTVQSSVQDGVKYVVYATENIRVDTDISSDINSGLSGGDGYMSIQDICPGDRVHVSGTVRLPEGASNPGGFDRELYYRGSGIGFDVVKGEVTFTGRGASLERMMYRLRQHLTESLYENMDEETASVAAGMLLGDKSGMDADTRLLYQKAGIAHVLAISGLHVGLIAGAVASLLSMLGLGKRTRSAVIIVLVILYGVMTGFSAATTRAVIMIVIKHTAVMAQRVDDMPTSMADAVIVMVAVMPYTIYSIGTYMSFAAVLGVYAAQCIYGRLRSSTQHAKRVDMVINSMLTSVMINVFMLPLIVMSYYEVPVYAMLLNLVVVPLLTLLAAVGFITAIIGCVPVVCAAAGAGGLICRLILWLYRVMSTFSLELPYSRISCGHMELWMAAVYYAVLGCMIVVMMRRTDRGQRHSAGRRAGALSIYRRRQPFVGLCRRDKDGTASADTKNGDRSMSVYGSRSTGLERSICICSELLLYAAAVLVCVGMYNCCRSRVVFIDVGQGDGSLVHSSDSVLSYVTGDSYNIVIDGGSTSENSVGQYAIIPVIKYYGISHIDCIFISHTDTDHVSGIIYMLQYAGMYNITVDRICIAADTQTDDNLAEIYTQAELRGIEVTELSAGDVVLLGCVEGEGAGIDEGMDETSTEVVGDDEEADENSANVEEKGKGEVEEDGNKGESSTSVGEKGEEVTEVEEDGKSGVDTDEDGHFERDCTDFRGISVNVLYPTGREVIEHSGNDYSLVLLVRVGDTGILYTGDISSDVEERLAAGGLKEEIGDIKDRGVETIVLKVPHHGSRYSSSEYLLECIGADIAVISVGEDNMYGHPTDEALERLSDAGCEIYRTDRGGAVILEP